MSNGLQKGLSPIISVTILIVISLAIAAMVGSWMFNIVSDTTNTTSSNTRQQIKCRYAGLDFDSSYGTYGVQWNFTGGTGDVLKVKALNTGTVDLYGFSFELTLESDDGYGIMHYIPTPATEITESDPFTASRSAIIEANITADINSSVYTLRQVKLLNSVCPQTAASIQF